MTQVTPSSGKLHFMKLDFEELAPNFFSFLFTKHFSSNLVQTFKSSVDVVERALASAPLWGDIPVKENMPILLGCSLTNHRYGWEGCAHAKNVCVCVCAHVCIRVFVLSSALCTSASMCRTSRNWKKEEQFFSSDSAENTLCRLWASSSVMSLSPRWCALWEPQPSASPACGPSATSVPVQSRGEQGWLRSAGSLLMLTCRLAPKPWSPQLSPPQPGLVTCWASSEHVIVGKTSSFCGTQTYPCHIDLLLHESWIMKSVLWFLRCSQHFVRLNLFHERNLSEEPNHRSSSKWEMTDNWISLPFAMATASGPLISSEFPVILIIWKH